MAQTKKKPVKQSIPNQVAELERLMQKVLRKAFKDSTLDYTVQIASTSIEPGVVKYGFMINGLKKEIQPIALSYDSYEVCKGVLEGMLTEVNPVELEKKFHEGRINVYTNAISSHEERLAQIEADPEAAEEDAAIPMEEVGAKPDETA